jgi:hypothetical protein
MPRTPPYVVRTPIPSPAEVAKELGLTLEQQRAVDDIVARTLELTAPAAYHLRARRARKSRSIGRASRKK